MQLHESEFLQDREASWNGQLDVPVQALFHKSKAAHALPAEPSSELLRTFSEASSRSGVTLEVSTSTNACLLNSADAEGFGPSCPVDSEAFLIKHYMDRIEGMDGLLLGKYRVQGTPRRRSAGQGLIAFASTDNHWDFRGPQDVVVKAYLCARTFERERRLLENPALRHVAAACIELMDWRETNSQVEGNSSGSGDLEEDRTLPLVVPDRLVPMLVVSEKGESLRELMRNRASTTTTITSGGHTPIHVIYGVAQLLRTMHDAGYAHRDIKPGNILWLPSSRAFSLIDFGCAAKAGWQMPLSFTLWYAAPETITAFKSGKQMCTADIAVDLFSFGIICFELLTGMSYYPPGVSTSGAGAMLTGRFQLPHESLSVQEGIAKLGPLHGSVLKLLARYPKERGSIHALLRVLEPMCDSGRPLDPDAASTN